MSKVIRVALVIAILLFAVGIVWAIIAAGRAARKPEPTAGKPTTPTLVGEPASTQPNPPASSPASSPSSASASPASRPTRTVTVIEETTFIETGASAWAATGATGDGSAWAEAHAE